MGKARYDAIRIAKELCYSEEVIENQNSNIRKRNNTDFAHGKGGTIKCKKQ